MNQTLAKGLYVAGVTTFCTFLGCWAVLAHQAGTQSSRKMTVADEEFAKKAAQGVMPATVDFPVPEKPVRKILRGAGLKSRL